MGVYKILNTKTGKLYIGSSINCRTRFNHHKHHLRKGNHPSYHLQNAWSLYGEDSFEFSVISIIEDRGLLEKEEQKWIDLYESYNQDKGYNLQRVAYSNKSYKWTDQWRKNWEASALSILKSEEFKEGCRQRNLGKVLSETTKERIREGNKGKTSYNIIAAHEALKRLYENTDFGKAIKAVSNGVEMIYPNMDKACTAYNISHSALYRALRKSDNYCKYRDTYSYYYESCL